MLYVQLNIDNYPVVESLIFSVLYFVCFLVFILLSVALSTLLERKLLGSMQRRKGPNVVGFFGFLQPFADALKAMIKENVVPRDADSFIFLLAPVFTFFCSLQVWSVIPLDAFDYPIYSINGILYMLIILSFSTYGIIFAGWASNSKYALLGGLRSTAQMISYEVCISFIFIIISMMSQSIDFKEIVNLQTNCWFVIPLLPLWIIFIICSLAETNRAPFDLPEAEAELVAGYNVEYSGIPFALFFISEYANLIATSTIASLLFFGGWIFPFYSGAVCLSVKTCLHMFLFIWIRATFPRYRYDQLMKLGWKVLLPLSLFFLFLFSFIYLHIDRYVSLFLLNEI